MPIIWVMTILPTKSREILAIDTRKKRGLARSSCLAPYPHPPKKEENLPNTAIEPRNVVKGN